MNKRLKIVLMTMMITPIILSIITFGIAEFPREASSKSELTFMTYNIHFGQGMDDLLNLERIAQNILIDDPDIIGLQEAEIGRVTSQGVDMAFWLAKRLGMNYYYANPSSNIHLMGNAILSKYPIVSCNAYNLPSTLQERIFIHCVVEISPTLNIDVFCTHIGIRTENKLAQVDFLLEKITEISLTSNRVLMGDFNLENDTIAIEHVLNYFNDTASEFGATNRASIDYVFATGYQNIIDYHVINDMLSAIDSPAEFGSDHLPVVSIIDFS
ncbi:MAG: endonuclease/exonuclease/phosphatase family protein [Candidatus Odinarchaeota archaeon]